MVGSRRCTSTARFRYTSDTVFDTFPWTQSPTLAQVKAVAEAAVTRERVEAVLKHAEHSLAVA